jgi:PEP-CTERM motif
VSGVTYRLSFDLGSFDLVGRPAAITASAGSRSETFTSPLSGGDDDWQTVTMEFTSVASSTVVTLQGQAGAFHIGLDNAVLTAVPEPATGALALVGLAAVVRRRRQPGAPPRAARPPG